MNNTKIICALIGLTGAVSNNGKTENTDDIFRKAIMSDDNAEIINLIHKEKYTISPDCETCPFPCGNTSDYDEEKYLECDETILKLKNEVVEKLKKLALDTNGELPELFLKSIAYLGYDLEAESYIDLLKELG